MDALEYVKSTWRMFTPYVFFKANPSSAIKTDPTDDVYVYSIHRIPSIGLIKEIETSSICFRLFSLHMLGMTEPIGYVFMPIVPPNYIVRYTPVAIVATHPNVTAESIANSETKVFFQSEYVTLLWKSCGVEIITDLSHKMAIHLGVTE